MEINKIVHKISLLHSTSAETPTSYKLVKEIIDQIDCDWADPNAKYLDPACGRGTFLLALVEKLSKWHDVDYIIKNMVYGVDISKVQSAIARKALYLVAETEPNVYCDDSLMREWDMEFDVIIGNPPYQGSNEDQANKLWPKIIVRSQTLLSKNGIMAFITPTSWMIPTADIGKGNSPASISIFNDIFKKNNLILANIDSDAIRSKYFDNVGSTFSYFVCQNAAYSGSTQIITNIKDNIIENINIQQIASLPKVTSKHSLSIVDKMIGTPFRFIDQNHGLNQEQKTKSKIFRYPIYHTNANNGTFWYSKNIPGYQRSPKIIISLSGIYKPVYNNSTGFSNMCIALIASSTKRAKIGEAVLSSKLYNFWVEMQKFSGFNPRKLILQLPAVDLTRTWTDAELYKHFGLTQEEIDYIEANVK